MVIKAVTFDLWRTLFIESARNASVDYADAQMLAILNRRGFPIRAEALQAALAACRSLAFERQKVQGIDFVPEDQVPWIIDYLGLPVTAQLADELLEPYTTSLLINPPDLIDGASEVLAELARNYQLALICNTGRSPGNTVREIMRRHGILQYFAVTAFSNELGVAKPNPRIFSHVLTALGVAPAEAVHIGDDPDTDVGGAKRSGLKAVWFNPYATPGDPDCDFRIAGLREMLPLAARRFA